MLTRIFLVIVFALQIPLLAQEKPEASKPAAAKPAEQHVYKLDFTLTEMEGGKRVDSKDYTVLISGDHNGKLRVSTRLPVPSGSAAQWQYMDVGVNIDATARHVSDKEVGIRTSMNISSVVLPTGEPEKMKTAAGQPLVRQFSNDSDTVIPLNKPTTLASMDEPNSKRSFQVQLTATLVR